MCACVMHVIFTFYLERKDEWSTSKYFKGSRALVPRFTYMYLHMWYYIGYYIWMMCGRRRGAEGMNKAGNE